MSTNTSNPTHYSRWEIEPIEFIRANKLDALRANIIKYIMRYDAKDGMKDLEKAQRYLDYLKDDWATKVILTKAQAAPYRMSATYPVERPCDVESGLVAAERALYDDKDEWPREE